MQNRRWLTRPLLCLVLLALAAPAGAQFITGRVLDANGVGVPGVDIDVDNVGGGGDPDIFNDGTDAFGVFTTTVPAGVYNVSFTPPAPPLSTNLVREVVNVIIAPGGTTNMGDVVLERGVALSGTLLNGSGFPIANADLDVVDLATGDGITLPGDFTSALGNFLVAVPRNGIRLDIEGPASPPAPRYAPLSFELDTSTDVDLGVMTLEDGFLLTGSVTQLGGGGVNNADIDVIDDVTGEKLFTPGDNTTFNGSFSVTVPVGTYDIEVCPPAGQLLVAADVENQVVTGNTTLPALELEPGALLMGNVTGPSGKPLQGIDLDVALSGTGTGVVTCRDGTDELGNYAIVVPFGAIDVCFEPGFDRPLLPLELTGVSADGLPLNVALERCRFPRTIGVGQAGSGGLVPTIGVSGGAPRFDNPDLRLNIGSTLGGTPCILRLTAERTNGVFLGGRNLALGQGGYGATPFLDVPSVPAFQFTFVMPGASGVPGAGGISFPLPPPLPLFANTPLYFQVVAADPAGRFGLAATPLLELTYRR